MKRSLWAKSIGLLAGEAGRGAAHTTEERSSYERFAIPYSFKPSLSFWEAVRAAMTAFLRIFLGSLLFAVWGTYTLWVWSALRQSLWLPVALLPLVLLFLILFALLMLAISALSRAVSRARS